MSDQYLKSADVAKLLNVSQRAVTQWAQDGRIRGVRTPGGHWRFHMSQVANLIETPVDS
jgi:excisionase family DNA binding protein